MGFAELPGGRLYVAAGSRDADWALNLRSNTSCTATIGERTGRYEARQLDEPARNEAIRALILKYGTPAERLGWGPAFELTPVHNGPA